MKKLPILMTNLFLGFLTLQAQNAIVGDGFSSGWGSFNSNSNFEYFGPSFGSSYIKTDFADGSGNQYFRLGIDWSSTYAQNTITVGSDVQVFSETEYTLNSNNTASGAMFINVGSTSYFYVFKTKDAGVNPSRQFIFFEVQGNIRSVSSVSQSPVSPNNNQSVLVTATLDGSFSSGQGAYLRYTTDNWANSTILEMTGSGTSYSATIPAQTGGTTIRYYVFTSGDGLSINHSKADWYTINANTNGGSNYTYESILPITLSSFISLPKTHAIQLRWSTSSEINNSHFEVERSANGADWDMLGKVNGHGTTSVPREYAFEDPTPLAGLNYYRLRQVDFDGTFAFSPVVVESMECLDAGALQVWPVPAASTVNLRWNGAEETTVEVLDAQGRLLRTLRIAPNGQFELPVGEFSSSLLFLRTVNAQGEVSIRKVVLM